MAEGTLAGKTAVITGAGDGLSFGIARHFGQAGAYTVVAASDAEAGSRAAARLQAEGLQASSQALDIRDRAQSIALVEALSHAGRTVDVWVNIAEVSYSSPAETYPREWWDESLSVMLSGVFYCCQAVGRTMLGRGHGVIVNLASVEGYRPLEGRVAYSVANAGLIMLTKALGVEWAGRGVRVVGIAPGAIEGDGTSRLMGATARVCQRRTPLGRLATVEEIAEAVLFLAGDEVPYIIGETMRVDGGWVSYQLF